MSDTQGRFLTMLQLAIALVSFISGYYYDTHLVSMVSTGNHPQHSLQGSRHLPRHPIHFETFIEEITSTSRPEDAVMNMLSFMPSRFPALSSLIQVLVTSVGGGARYRHIHAPHGAVQDHIDSSTSINGASERIVAFPPFLAVSLGSGGLSVGDNFVNVRNGTHIAHFSLRAVVLRTSANRGDELRYRIQYTRYVGDVARSDLVHSLVLYSLLSIGSIADQSLFPAPFPVPQRIAGITSMGTPRGHEGGACWRFGRQIGCRGLCMYTQRAAEELSRWEMDERSLLTQLIQVGPAGLQSYDSSVSVHDRSRLGLRPDFIYHMRDAEGEYVVVVECDGTFHDSEECCPIYEAGRMRAISAIMGLPVFFIRHSLGAHTPAWGVPLTQTQRGLRTAWVLRYLAENGRPARGCGWRLGVAHMYQLGDDGIGGADVNPMLLDYQLRFVRMDEHENPAIAARSAMSLRMDEVLMHCIEALTRGGDAMAEAMGMLSREQFYSRVHSITTAVHSTIDVVTFGRYMRSTARYRAAAGHSGAESLVERLDNIHRDAIQAYAQQRQLPARENAGDAPVGDSSSISVRAIPAGDLWRMQALAAHQSSEQRRIVGGTFTVLPWSVYTHPINRYSYSPEELLRIGIDGDPRWRQRQELLIMSERLRMVASDQRLLGSFVEILGMMHGIGMRDTLTGHDQEYMFGRNEHGPVNNAVRDRIVGEWLLLDNELRVAIDNLPLTGDMSLVDEVLGRMVALYKVERLNILW